METIIILIGVGYFIGFVAIAILGIMSTLN
jgi:nitrogen fixation-related uncharacterized protein